jgi:SAM-dependent methyltransferase
VAGFGGAYFTIGSTGAFDAILAYSVLHYVGSEADVLAFLDRALELLAHGGTMLIGDIPNASKRTRFLSSPAGIAYHKRFMQTDEPPDLTPRGADADRIDDELVLRLLARARAAGFDAYVVPLRPDLPLANRREDVVVHRP